MLHHKACIQAARDAFGMGTLTEEDELDRINASHTNSVLEEPRRLSESDRPVAPGGNGSSATTTVNLPAVSTEPAASALPRAQIPNNDTQPIADRAPDDADDGKRVL